MNSSYTVASLVLVKTSLVLVKYIYSIYSIRGY